MIDRPTGWHLATLLLAPALFLALYAVHAPEAVLIQPDSEGYLTYSVGRSGGYPAFLALLKPFIRDVADYAIAQRFLYAIAVLVLGYQLLRGFGSLALALVAEVVLLFNPEVNRYHFSIVTESLFVSVSALFLAAALAYLRSGGLAALATASVLAAYAAIVRPTGLVLVITLVLLVLAGRRLQWPRVWKSALLVILPILVLLPLESHIYQARNPGPRLSLVPFHLIAKSGMVATEDAEQIIAAAPPKTQPLHRALEVTLAPVRQLIAEAPNQAARCKLIVNYEVLLQYEFALKERALVTGGGALSPLIDVALARLKTAVGDYLRLSTDHLQCVWSLGAATKEQQAQFAAYLESRRPLPFEKSILAALAGSRSPPFASAVMIVMWSIAAVLLAASVALVLVLMRLRRPSLPLAVAGIAGAIVHGSLLLVALTGVGEPRYVLGLWVPIAIGIGMSTVWLTSSFGFWPLDQAGMRK